ncbi:MAG: prolyl oligopeptidase family serine peptidase [Candidatus Hydrogenedentes bacterium]|nr:prolyl oligopeptidase family serine peptidase [Candidatus Hydrogenedentota bacterium]
MTPVFIVALLCAAGCGALSTKTTDSLQTSEHFTKEIKSTVETNYLLFLPENYDQTQQQWPLLLFLHGAGERGDDLSKVEVHGPPRLIADGKKDFPFIVVSPQCPKDAWWSDGPQIDALDALLSHLIKTYRIDENRIYATGLSMGGFGTWRLACEYPDRFAAIVPICGSGEPYRAHKIRHLPVWVFHGAKDDVIPIQSSQMMVDALKKAEGNVEFTIYPEAGHDAWTETYNNAALYEWLLQQRRSLNK